MKIYLQRIIIPLLILSLVVCVPFLLAPSASASVLEAPLYQESIDVYGETSEITYRILGVDMEVRLYDASDGYRLVYVDRGRSFHSLPLVPGHRYRITISPFGFRQPHNGLLASSLPKTFVMRCGFGFVYDNPDDTGYATIVQPSGIAYWYNDSELLTSQELLMNNQNGKTVVTTDRNTFDQPDGATCFSLEFQFNNISFESDPVPAGIYTEDFTMKIAVSSDDLLQNFYQWTRGDPDVYNELVSAVGGLEGILGGNSPVHKPPSIDSVEDVDDLEKDIMDFLDEGFGDYGDLLSGFATVVLNVGPALKFVSWMLTRISGIRFFSVIISTVCALGLTAFVLNLVVTISTRYRNKGGDS